MNPIKDGEPTLPTFTVDVANPLPSADAFIAQVNGFVMPPLLGFFTAIVSAILIWKVIQIFYK